MRDLIVPIQVCGKPWSPGSKLMGLGDPGRQRDITEVIKALDGVTETKIEKGALYVSYDPLVTSEKKIENAIRPTGDSIKAAATETAQPDLPTATDVEQTGA